MLPKKRNKNRIKRITAAVVMCGVLVVVAMLDVYKRQACVCRSIYRYEG